MSCLVFLVTPSLKYGLIKLDDFLCLLEKLAFYFLILIHISFPLQHIPVVGSIFGDSFYDQQLASRQTNALSHQVTKTTSNQGQNVVLTLLCLTNLCFSAWAVQHDWKSHQLVQPFQPMLHPQLHAGGHDGPHRQQLTGLAATQLQ